MEKLGNLDTKVYEAMLEAFPAAMFFADSEGKIRVWNEVAVDISGVSAEEIKGNTLTQAGLNPEICDQEDRSSIVDAMECDLNTYLQDLRTKPTDAEKNTFCLHLAGIPGFSSDFLCTPVYSQKDSLLGVVGTSFSGVHPFYPSHCSHIVSVEDASAGAENICNVLGATAFYDALNRDWHRYQRYQSIFSILSLEIDHYSHFESVMGASAANELINSAIVKIGTSLRRSDIIGQVGASRFIILLSNSDRKSALKVANMLLENLHQQTCFDLPFVMSASIGAVSVEDKQSLDKTLERAENALQRSVELGRNQVTFWG